MDSIALKELIGTIVKDYEFLSSLQDDNKWEHIKKIQSQILSMMKQVFELNSLVTKLKKSTSGKSQGQMVLEFIQHLLTNFHYIHVFVPSPIEHDTQECRDVYKDFIFWTINKLLMLQSKVDTIPIHKNIVETVCTLMSVAKTKNIEFHATILEELFKTMKEISMHIHRLSTSEDYPAVLSAKLEVFVTKHNDDDESSITMELLTEIELFCKNFYNLFQTALPDILRLVPIAKYEVWPCILEQTQTGSYVTMTAAYRIITQLMETTTPSDKNFHLFMHCILTSFEEKFRKNEDELNIEHAEYNDEISNIIQRYFYVFLKWNDEKSESVISIKNEIPFAYLKLLIHALPKLLSEFNDSANYAMHLQNDFVNFITHIFAMLNQNGLLYQAHTSYAILLETGVEKLFELALEMYLDSNQNIQIAICIAILWEIKNFCNQNTANHFSIQDLKLTYKICMQYQNLLNKMLRSIKVESGTIPDGVFKQFRQYVRYLRLFNIVIHLVFTTKTNQKSRDKVMSIINKFYNKDALHRLIKACLRVLVIVRRTTMQNEDNLKHFISAFTDCIQLFKPTVLCQSILRTHGKILAMDDSITYALIIFYSLPWLTTGSHDDLESLFNNAKWLPKSELIQLSESLSQAGLNSNPDVANPDKVSYSVIISCLYALSLFSKKHALRWRSNIITKWSLCQNSTSIVKSSCMPIYLLLSTTNKVNFPHLDAIKSEIANLLKKFNATDEACFACNVLPETLLMNSYVKLQFEASYVDLLFVPNSLESIQFCTAHDEGIFDDFALKYTANERTNQNFNIGNKTDVNFVCSVLYGITNEICNQSTKQESCFQLLWKYHLSTLLTCLNAFKRSILNSSIENLLSSCISNLRKVSCSRTPTHYLELAMREVLILDDVSAEWNSIVMNTITDLTVKAKENPISREKNEELCHLVEVCGCIAQLSIRNSETLTKLLEWSLEKLCAEVASSFPLVQSSAFLQLDLVLKSQDRLLFDEHRQIFCSCVAKSIINAESSKRPPHEILDDFAELSDCSTSVFLMTNLQYILPIVVTSERSTELVNLICSILERPAAEVLRENFKYIYCYATVNGKPLKSIETKTRLNEKSLILLTFGSLVHLLLSYISVNYEAVFKKLQEITSIKAEAPCSSPNKSVSELLQPHLLGFITFLNGQLRSSSTLLSEKTRMLESFVKVLQLIDPYYVNSVRIKIINTVSLAQNLSRQRNWKHLCIRAWSCFLHRIEPSCLATILSQIAVTVLPLLEEFPNEVSKLLSFMILDQCEHTESNLHELYFIPPHDLLKNVHSAIAKQISRKFKKQDLSLQLQQELHLTTHESTEVRVQALTRLRETLHDCQRALQEHVCASTEIGVTDATLSQMVVTLLTNCRDTNKNVRLLAAKCLGLLGAIDPDRFFINFPQNYSKTNSYFQMDDMNFAYDLISETVKAFMTSKPAHQDITAFAIQELLKSYDCHDGGRETFGRRLWRKFPENIQEILEPHLSSRYILKTTDQPISNLNQSIFMRKSNMSFREWIGSFCALVLQMVYQTNKTSTAGRVFYACSAVVRNDVNVALFLLPHAMLHALVHTNYADFIKQEILTVLKSTRNVTAAKDVTQQFIQLTNSSMQSSINTSTQPEQSSLQQLSQLAAQAVFSMIDHAMHFIRTVDASTTNSQAKNSVSRLRSDESVANVKSFLSSVPQLELSRAAFACRSHTRALMHYELHLQSPMTSSQFGFSSGVIVPNGDSQEQSSINIDFLQQLFTEMDEPDGVAGVAAVTDDKPTINLQIKLLESVGNLQDAQVCYEHAIANEPDNFSVYKDYVKCLMDLGQMTTAACNIDWKLKTQPGWKKELESYQLEAAWRLGQWDMVEEKLTSPEIGESWNHKLGQLLLHTKNSKWQECHSVLNDLYQDQAGPLSAASMEHGSYQRGYEYILRLHMLSEVESFISICQSQNHSNVDMSSHYDMWQLRTQSVQMSFRAREPILSLRRTLANIAKDIHKDDGDSTSADRIVGKLWLQSANCARKTGFVQTAYSSLINAQKFNLPEYCIEHAKWLWKKDESHEALLALQPSVSETLSSNTTMDANARLIRAKAMLLVGRLMEESSSFDSSKVIQQFKEVTMYMNEWEDAHFFRGKYYDKIMNLMSRNDAITLGNFSVLYQIMTNYGQSLRYGTNHIYESLTKLLTIWFDFGAKVVGSGASVKQTREMHDNCQQMISVMSDLRKSLPAYVFLVGFSQLVSRICHQHMPTFTELKEMLVKVIVAYPQQALWSLMAISKSSYPERAQRCKQIFAHAEKQDHSLAKLLSDATRLTDRLLELSNKPCASVQSLSIDKHFKPLRQLIAERNFSEILVPLQRLMTVTLPHISVGKSLSSGSSTQARQLSHNPFHETPAYFVGFEDLVEVLPSLQRPKKVSVRGSDGVTYLFLCKPKDDLRKDARLMEFNTIVNKCLNREAESRKRQLKIRTYAVVPLNEECGLIEWVPNTQGLRHILLKIYKSMNKYTPAKVLKKFMLPNNAPFETKMTIYRDELLPRHPPVFKDWFVAQFPNPTQWYNARLAYSRSTAVMSMVGYILGLGDRHGENILFDSRSGEAVHVDFNCLFNKGLSLDVPEIVPFRLTHNMVDAMGPVKYEGFFRIACETVMKILREQKEPLLSVLKTFIYDPLVEWSRSRRGSKMNGNTSSEAGGEIVNEKAKTHINEIDKRLRGITSTKHKGLPLSVRGHVHYLIQEATDEKKLCQMYIGWAPFM